MFFGRNEGNGLRCVYHGVKFDVTGACVDVPCAPPTSPQIMDSMKRALRTVAYPCMERGGLVWTYMGPGELAWSHIGPDQTAALHAGIGDSAQGAFH